MILETATEYLKKMYSNTTSDSLTLPEIYSAFNRSTQDPRTNRTWFGNKLTFLKRHNLVTPIYIVKDNSQVLDKIQLTEEGKKILGRTGSVQQPAPATEKEAASQPVPQSPQVVSEEHSTPASLPQVEQSEKAMTEKTQNGKKEANVISLSEVMQMIAELRKEQKSNFAVDINIRDGIVSIRL